MSYFRISLAGDLGSGKSTVGQILQKRFCADVISIGKIQREMAEKLGMDTTEFNQYQESHPELDKELDDSLAAYEKKEGSYIFDSRMAWYFVPSAFSVYLKCNPEEAAERVLYAKRIDETYQSPEEAFKRLKERRESEIQRYKYDQLRFGYRHDGKISRSGRRRNSSRVGKNARFRRKRQKLTERKYYYALGRENSGRTY